MFFFFSFLFLFVSFSPCLLCSFFFFCFFFLFSIFFLFSFLFIIFHFLSCFSFLSFFPPILFCIFFPLLLFLFISSFSFTLPVLYFFFFFFFLLFLGIKLDLRQVQKHKRIKWNPSGKASLIPPRGIKSHNQYCIFIISKNPSSINVLNCFPYAKYFTILTKTKFINFENNYCLDLKR